MKTEKFKDEITRKPNIRLLGVVKAQSHSHFPKWFNINGKCDNDKLTLTEEIIQ